MVASTAIATASPTPNCFTVGSPLKMKLVKTLIMISAAAVITRAVEADRDHRLAVVTRLAEVLVHAAEQEHLVVHREAEQDREHHQRHEALDRDRVVEADQAGRPTPLNTATSTP